MNSDPSIEPGSFQEPHIVPLVKSTWQIELSWLASTYSQVHRQQQMIGSDVFSNTLEKVDVLVHLSLALWGICVDHESQGQNFKYILAFWFTVLC